MEPAKLPLQVIQELYRRFQIFRPFPPKWSTHDYSELQSVEGAFKKNIEIKIRNKRFACLSDALT